ncbi:MAG: efflux RND transporter periplasmic adaptor subunit [Oligoflexia bacterium]|nr:efflux RND transporter periplasmic adaptor subunit [Oligoflexia bacterium]
MKSNFKKIILFVIIPFILIVACSSWYFFYKKDSSSQITYSEEEVVKDDIEVTILSTGVIQPKNRLEIKPPIAGRLDKIFVNEGDLVRRGQTLAMMSSLERAALLDSARGQGVAELKRWEELYKAVPIIAPISGRIILRNVEVGQTFTTNESVFVMSDMLTVKAQVDETDISQIVLKQNARVILDAYPNETITANVDKIAYDAKTVNNVTTYLVDVLPSKIPPYMRSGMTANVIFVVAMKENVLVIANEAIKIQNGKKMVLLSRSSSNMNREIVTGISDGKNSEVISGLAEGDVVLVAEMKMDAKSKDRSLQKGNPFNLMGKRPKEKR